MGVASPAQGIEQRRGASLQIILQLGMDAQRDLVDRELARVVAADADELDQRLGLLYFGRVEHRVGADLVRLARAQQTPHTARNGLDLRLDEARNLAADGRELSCPWRIAGEIHFGAQ